LKEDEVNVMEKHTMHSEELNAKVKMIESDLDPEEAFLWHCLVVLTVR